MHASLEYMPLNDFILTDYYDLHHQAPVVDAEVGYLLGSIIGA